MTGLGARSIETVRQWLAGLAPGASVTVTPVVDLTEQISVNAYEAPDRLRAQVENATTTVAGFPGVAGRAVTTWTTSSPTSTPTRVGRRVRRQRGTLAPLSRFHHRVKTHSEWDYRREPAGSLTWTSPLGRTYTVDQHGTRAHD